MPPQPATPRAHAWTGATLLCVTLALIVVVGIPVAGAFALFSGIGFGDDTYRSLHKHYELCDDIFAAGAAFLLLVYLLDVSYWRGTSGCVARRFSLTLGFGGLAAGAVLATEKYPAAPFALFTLATPLYVAAARHIFFGWMRRPGDNALFLLGLAISTAIVSCIGLFVWLWWVFGGNLAGIHVQPHLWNEQTRQNFRQQMGCPDKTYNSANTEDYCLEAYLLWFAPFIACISGLIMAFVCFVCSRWLRGHNELSGDSDGYSDGSAIGRRTRLAARFMCWLVALCVVGMWVAASVAGAGMQLSNVVVTFTSVALLLVIGLVASQVGWRAIHAELHTIPLVRRLAGAFSSDWAKALFLLMAAPCIGLYVMIAALNQLLRRFLPFTKELRAAMVRDPSIILGEGVGEIPSAGFDTAMQREAELEPELDEESLCVTLVCYRQLRLLSAWAWTSVLSKVVWWCIFFVVIVVGVGKVVTLTLAALNSYLSAAFSPIATTFIFIGIGLTMFLLPPVPGVPVYLAGGIILTNAYRPSVGFWCAALLTVGVCFCIKLMAIACQQKAIGERMSENISVKKFVGVNSLSIRAIRHILSEPGLAFLNPRKVAILCGGPDWPTSVLTGILKLSLPDMLLGSTPVIFLIAPCVFAGAFQLRRNEGDKWQTIAGVTLAVAAMVQMVALVAAAYFIENVADAHAPSLRAEEDDVEVQRREAADRLRAERYERATRWHRVNWLMRVVLVIGAVVAGLVCYALQFGAQYCFEEFVVTDTIHEKLNGDALNLVKRPWGIIAGLLFAASLTCLGLFRTYAWCCLIKGSDAELEATPLDTATVPFVGATAYTDV